MPPTSNTHAHPRSHSKKGLFACFRGGGTSRNVFPVSSHSLPVSRPATHTHTHISETLFLSSWKILCLFRSRKCCLSLTNTRPRAASTVSHNRAANSFCACDCVCVCVCVCEHTHEHEQKRPVPESVSCRWKRVHLFLGRKSPR